MLASLNTPGVEGFSSLYLSLFGVLFGLFGACYLRNILFSALSGGALCMTLQSLFRYVFHDLLFYGMGPAEALAALGTRMLLSLPVGALAYLLLRAIHRRFTEDAS